MGLNVGNLPVKQVYVGSTPVTAVYVGAEKVWPTRETVQITLGSGTQARDQLRAALSARGLNYATVTEIPFDIELVGTGSVYQMFYYCPELTHVPAMDTSGVTNMNSMFQYCYSLTSVPVMDTSSVTDMRNMFYYCESLTSVPDLDTSNVTDTSGMFYYCSSLTDGNVRLIGRHPNVGTVSMIYMSGLTREPWHTVGDPPDGVHQVSVTDARGSNVIWPLVSAIPRAGETWNVRIQGTITKATSISGRQPEVKIGGETFGPFWQGDTVDCSGTVTSANNTIAIHTVVNSSGSQVSFVGTVTIET